MLNKFSNQKGSIIALGLIISTSMAVILSAILQRIIVENNLNQFSENNALALNVAEAGAEETLQMMINGVSFTGWTSTTVSGKTTVSYPPLNTSPKSIPNVGEYDVSVWDPTGANPRIDITGYVPNKSNFKARRKISVVLLANAGGVHPGPIVAQGDIRLNATTVDSYKSSDGVYNQTYGGVLNKYSNGNLYTKQTTNQSIYLLGSAIVNGKALCGESLSCTSNLNNAIDINTGSSISGGKNANTETVTLPTIVVPELVDSSVPGYLPPRTSITPGQSPTITQSGHYTSIDLSSGDVLTFTGDVTIYVDTLNVSSSTSNPTHIKLTNGAKVRMIVANTFQFGSGSQINANADGGRDPKRFSLEAADSFTGVGTQGIRFYGNSTFYGSVKATYAGVDLGSNTTFYGAINSKRTYVASGSVIHYDESLGGSDGPAFSVVSWVDKGSN